MMQFFQDHFSGHASDYARYRPVYPRALYAAIRGVASGGTVWDAGCGNGQASLGLAEFFDRVIATDPSAEQVAQAGSNPRVEYRVEPGESPTLKDGQADAVTVFQALHWFDFQRFHQAVRRVAKSGAPVLAFMYDVARVSPEIDIILNRSFRDQVGLRRYWPGDRRYVDSHYASIPWHFEPLEFPLFTMEMRWSLDDMIGYLSTWSAHNRSIAAGEPDLLPGLREELNALWTEPRPVLWTLHRLAGRV
jgi:SAM-dependent methyltransferase